MIDFTKSKMTKEDYLKLKVIADRVHILAGTPLERLAWAMDIEAANMVCPLDLEALLSFDNDSFLHDVCGIANHLNRDTGQLEDCFRPRCAK